MDADTLKKKLRKQSPLMMSPMAFALAACGGDSESEAPIFESETSGNDYQRIINFGVSNPNSQAVEVFSDKGYTTYDLSRISSSNDRVVFKDYSFATSEIKLDDLNKDGVLTIQNYEKNGELSEAVDVLVFESEAGIYDTISDNATDYATLYFVAKDTGSIFSYQNSGGAPIVNLVANVSDEISEVGVNVMPGVSNLSLSLSELSDDTKDITVQGTTADSMFSNFYTLTVADIPPRFLVISEQLIKVGTEVIHNISNYVKWEGTLDFAIQFDGRDSYGPAGYFSTDDRGPGMPSLPYDAGNGYVVAHYEALFGVDLNGTDFDLGTNLLPDSEGTLTNYGSPIYINTNQNPSNDDEVPQGYHDFFSVFTHEILHTMGIMSVEWNTAINDLIEVTNGEQFYVGQHVVDLVGGVVPYNNGHFGELPDGTRGGVMHEFGFYDGRWEFGQLEVAVFKDLGYIVADTTDLPILDTDHVAIM